MNRRLLLATTTLSAIALVFGFLTVCDAQDAGAAKEDPAMKAIQELVQKAGVDTSKPNWKTSLPKPQAVSFDPARKYYVRMVTTKGPIRIRMMPEVAPMHVTSFLYLTQLGFYDDLAFHRVITGFMAQGGCPLGTGTGGPGYEYGGEFSPNVKHDRPGLLSMANRGPNTDGSQFFLTFVPTPWLDGKHTIYGEVVEGMDTLKALEAAGSQSGRTKEPLKLEKVTIEVE
ncbi:MAG: peptidylprolyl isomerase [Deferrisomatales bacterium]|nr:peptidylprolyl isomerase [Deferrisomatales bacterium]